MKIRELRTKIDYDEDVQLGNYLLCRNSKIIACFKITKYDCITPIEIDFENGMIITNNGETPEQAFDKMVDNYLTEKPDFQNTINL